MRQQHAQRVRVEHAHVAAPAEQPLENVAFVAHVQCHQQAIFVLLLGDGEERGRLAHLVGSRGIEQRAHNQRAQPIIFALIECEIGRTHECLRQNCELIHAINSEVA